MLTGNAALFPSTTPPAASAGALFQRVRASVSLEEIAARIGLHVNTVARWAEQSAVPRHYRMDFLRMLGEPVVPAVAGDAMERELDRFFTKRTAARKCFAVFEREAKKIGVDLSRRCHIEPSAGGGCFTDLLPAGRRIALDLVSRRRDIVPADFLTWTPPKRAGMRLWETRPLGCADTRRCNSSITPPTSPMSSGSFCRNFLKATARARR